MRNAKQIAVLALVLLPAGFHQANALRADESHLITGQFVASPDLTPAQKVPRERIEKSGKDAEQFLAGGGPLLPGWQIDEQTRGIANVVVYIAYDSDADEDRAKAKSLPSQADQTFEEANGFALRELDATLRAKKKRVSDLALPASTIRITRGRCAPSVVALQAGQPLVVVSDEPVPYTVELRQKSRGLFLTKSYPGVLLSETKLRDSVSSERISIDSPTHPWMHADVLICRHPYFAISDAQGHFRLAVPRGRYEFQSWCHGRYIDPQSGKTDLKPTSLDVDASKAVDLGKIEVQEE